MPAAAPSTTDSRLAPELEAVATAAADLLRAQADPNAHDQHQSSQMVVQAASAAITAGTPLAAIADAERIGQARARAQSRPDMLRRVERAARRRREADAEYEQAITRAARFGLAHREIAAAADVAHATVRSIIARADAPPEHDAPSPEPITTDAEPHDPTQDAQ